jgi:flagellar biosynthesis GTPase FlhF
LRYNIQGNQFLIAKNRRRSLLKPVHTLLIFNNIQLFATGGSGNDDGSGGGLFGERDVQHVHQPDGRIEDEDNEDESEDDEDEDEEDSEEDGEEDGESYEEDEESVKNNDNSALDQLIKSSFQEVEKEKEEQNKKIKQEAQRVKSNPHGELNEKGKLLTYEEGQETQFIAKLVYYSMRATHPTKRVYLFFTFFFPVFFPSFHFF